MGELKFFRSLPRFSWREHADPVDVDSFNQAMRIFFSALETNMTRSARPDSRQPMSLADVYDALTAVLEHFKNDQDLALRLLLRINAFSNIWLSRGMRPWLTMDERGVTVHPAVIEACASAALVDPGHFDERRLLQAIEAIATGGESEEQPPSDAA